RDFHVTGVQTCALPIFADGARFSAGKARRRRNRAAALLSRRRADAGGGDAGGLSQAVGEFLSQRNVDNGDEARVLSVTRAIREQIGRATCRERGCIGMK